MNQRQFYNLPEVQEQLDIQKTNKHGSEKHKAAHIRVGEIAKEQDVYEQYAEANGLIY